MKKVLTVIIIVLFSTSAFSQFKDTHMDELAKVLKDGGKSDEEINSIINSLIKNPELYNTLWKNFLDQIQSQDSVKWKLLKDFNVQFKTFQTNDNPIGSLGFSYDFNYDYAKFVEKNDNRISNSFGLSAKGNVAFKKQLNPANFLETKVHYNYSHFIGGVVKQSDTAVFTQLNDIRFKLAGIKDMQSKEAIELWNQLGKKLQMSNQYYYSISPKFAFESNQDFSDRQFVPGVAIDLGAKAWNTNSALAKLNIFDYPFAALRYIIGTDKNFTIYGSTIPTAQIQFDYVIPSNDTVRKDIVGNLDPFPRVKFETGFRTFIARVKKENIFFNANYRYYYEVNASEKIKKADLGADSYFVMALQTTSGFYVSYANGRLPFDAKTDEIYSIGFNYKFN